MRRTIGIVLAIWGWLVIAAGGALFLWAYLAPVNAWQTAQEVRNLIGVPSASEVLAQAPGGVGSTSELVIGAVLCFLALFALLLAFVGRSRPELSIRFETKEGSVPMEISAIEDCLRTMLEADPEVTRGAITLRVREEGTEQIVDCLAHISLLEGPDRPAKIEAAVQRAIRTRFEEILPGVATIRIHPHISLRPAGRGATVRRAPEESPKPTSAESEPGFRGLASYPVEPEQEQKTGNDIELPRDGEQAM